MGLLDFISRGNFSRSAYQSVVNSRRHRRTVRQALVYTWLTLCTAVSRLETSVDPSITFARLREHKWSLYDLEYVFDVALWMSMLSIIPSVLLRFGIPVLYLIAISESLRSCLEIILSQILASKTSSSDYCSIVSLRIVRLLPVRLNIIYQFLPRSTHSNMGPHILFLPFHPR